MCPPVNWRSTRSAGLDAFSSGIVVLDPRPRTAPRKPMARINRSTVQRAEGIRSRFNCRYATAVTIVGGKLNSNRNYDDKELSRDVTTNGIRRHVDTRAYWNFYLTLQIGLVSRADDTGRGIVLCGVAPSIGVIIGSFMGGMLVHGSTFFPLAQAGAVLCVTGIACTIASMTRMKANDASNPAPHAAS